MLPGLYNAASGMIAVEKRQDIIANNLANASTPGYKRMQPVQLGFYEVFSQKQIHPFRFDREAAPAGGVKAVESFTNLASGPLRVTEDPLSLALRGPGYIAIETAGGERYTRAGQFSLDVEGYLTTSEGNRVASITGEPISVNGEQIVISAEGLVLVDGIAAGQIRMREFEDPTRLERVGDNLFMASEEVLTQSSEPVDTFLDQGAIELSNVQLPVEMGNMMLGLRAYEANQKVIQAIDATVGRLIDQVGSPG